MKKKVLFLTLATAVVLTACGGKSEGEGSAPAADETIAEVEAEVEAEAEAEIEAEVETEEAAAQEEAPAQEASGDYMKGTTSESGWESEYLGLRYTAPEGMTMSTDEELNQMMGLGEDILSEDFSELQLEYAKMNSVYEMMSVDELGTTNVVLTSEKLPSSGMDANAYVDAVRQGLSSVSEIQYTISEEVEAVPVGGIDFVKVACNANYSGVSMYQDYYIAIINDRAVSIALTYIDETADMAQQVINSFEAY